MTSVITPIKDQRYVCIACGDIVLGQDTVSHCHAAKHTTAAARMPAARANLGGIVMTEARWISRSWQLAPQSTRITTTTVSAPLIVGNTALIMGISPKGLASATSSTLAVGGMLGDDGARGCLDEVIKLAGFKIDVSSFILDFAIMYAATSGSTKETAAGSFYLQPDTQVPTTGINKVLTLWTSIYAIWAKYGTTIGIQALTPRMFFKAEGIFETIEELYKTHPAFAAYRAGGHPRASAAMMKNEIWYFCLPGVYERSARQLTDYDMESILVAHNNANVDQEASTVPYSMQFDGAHTRINAVPKPPKSTDANDITNRLTLKAMANALRK